MCTIPTIVFSATIVKYDFESPSEVKEWIGWSTVSQKVEIVNDDGNNVLQLTIKGKEWNTAIISLKPPVVITATTVLRFKIKTSQPGGWGINLQNSSEEAEYETIFSVAEKDKWTTVVILLKDAAYKRHGKEGVEFDGMLGDQLGRVQITFRGEKCLIDDFEIINFKESELKDLVVDNKFITAYKETHQPQNYSQLARNGIFPFGVIITLNADRNNANFFGQTPLERYQNSMLELKKDGFNTLSNFCNNFGDDLTLKLMKEYHLYLLATSTCGKKLHSLPENHKVIQSIKKNSFHPNLLAWYGQDEPTDIELYLKNKKRIEAFAAGGAPCVSAMCMNSVVKTLAPCMDVIIIDPYTLTEKFDPISSSTNLSKHRINVKLAKTCMGKRVWVIPQAFGMRGHGRRTLRYPEPVEVRFNAFNDLAAGANGLIYFIYEDTVPYLDKQLRGEEFDQTMVDAWGNKNETCKELVKIGRRLTPIMPSFLDVKESKELKINCANSKIIVRQWENELGTLVFCVNSDLSSSIETKISFDLPLKNKVYNLDTLTPFEDASVNLNINPGDGQLLLIANDKQFAQAALEINFRKSVACWESMDVELNVLKKAGFDTSKIRQELAEIEPDKKGTPKLISADTLNHLEKQISDLRKSNSIYCNVADHLERVKKIFGEINASLVAPGVIEKVDTNPKFYPFFDTIKEAGKDYFSMRQDWQNGKFENSGKKLLELEKTLVELKKQIALKLHKNGITKMW